MTRLLATILLFSFLSISAQEINIVPELKLIEAGELDAARTSLAKLKSTSPDDPSVIFLDAVLTTQGDIAVDKYNTIYQKYPESNYADAALYRIFSYYYSLGVYKKAEEYLGELKSGYPDSPYIKAADRNIPDKDFDAEVVEIKSAPEQKVIIPVVTKTTSNFTVQAGAFLNIANAKSLQSKIQSDGYFSEIRPKEVGGSILNVVMVGKLQTEDKAAQILDYLRTKHKLNGRIVSIN